MGKINGLIRKSKIFIGLESSVKIDFIKVFIYTGFARAFILFVPFNKLRKYIGTVKSESPEEVNIDTYRVAKSIATIVRLVSKNTPWESLCLVQALTAQKLLKEKGIASTLYLGVKKDKENNMLAHAWVRCGKYILTGGANKDGYAVVAKFTR